MGHCRTFLLCFLGNTLGIIVLLKPSSSLQSWRLWSGLCQVTLSENPDWWSTGPKVVRVWDFSFSGSFSTVATGSFVICQIEALHPRLFSLASRPDLRSLLVVANSVRFRVMDAAVPRSTLNAAEPIRSQSWHNPFSQIYRLFFQLHGLFLILSNTSTLILFIE